MPPATPEVVESGRPTLFLVLIVSGYASDVRSGKGSRRRQHEGPYLPPVESRISQCEVEHQCNTKGTTSSHRAATGVLFVPGREADY